MFVLLGGTAMPERRAVGEGRGSGRAQGLDLPSRCSLGAEAQRSAAQQQVRRQKGHRRSFSIQGPVRGLQGSRGHGGVGPPPATPMLYFAGIGASASTARHRSDQVLQDSKCRLRSRRGTGHPHPQSYPLLMSASKKEKIVSHHGRVKTTNTLSAPNWTGLGQSGIAKASRALAKAQAAAISALLNP